jgi:hypothetical protein
METLDCKPNIIFFNSTSLLTYREHTFLAIWYVQFLICKQLHKEDVLEFSFFESDLPIAGSESAYSDGLCLFLC